MGVGILAPVPANILRSALDTCAKAGRVAFGSDAWELFDKASREYGEGLPVLIYPTHHYGDPDKLWDPGYATFRGIYLGTKLAQTPRACDFPSIFSIMAKIGAFQSAALHLNAVLPRRSKKGEQSSLGCTALHGGLGRSAAIQFWWGPLSAPRR